MTQNALDSTILCCSLLTSFVIPSIYISLTVLFVYFLSFRRGSEKHLVNFPHSLDDIYQFLSSISPLCHRNGWECFGVQDGCRIWCFNHARSSVAYGDTFHSISFLAHTSINNLVSVFLDPKEITEWNYLFKINFQDSEFVFDSVVSQSQGRSMFDVQMAYFLSFVNFGGVDWQLNIHWKKFDDNVLIVYSPLPPVLFDFHSIIILISTISHTRVLSNISIFFLSYKHILFSEKSFSVFKLATSIKDYIYMKQSGAYLSNTTVKTDSHVNIRLENDPHPNSKASVKSKYFHETEHQYVSLIDSKVFQFLSMASPKSEDNWIYVGITKEIQIWKLEPKIHESSSLTVRGKGTINVSPSICIRFFADERNSSRLDDMFESAPLVGHINRHTQVRNLRYKTIWPLKRRDFCPLLCVLQISIYDWCIICFTIEHPDCPVSPEFVRGSVFAGYLISGSSSNPNSCTVTLVITIDLKGSMPSWAINRLMTSQPMIIYKAKHILESCVSPLGSTIQQLDLVDKNALPPAPQSSSEEPSCSNNLKSNDDTKFKHSSNSAPSVILANTDVPPLEDSSYLISTCDAGASITNRIDRPLQILRFSKGDELDNLLSISVELNISVQDEIKEALMVKIDFNKLILDHSPSSIGKWQFIGFEKEIVIMRKEFNNNVHGFLGMGVIQFPPSKVFDILRNVQNRFAYDNMLKNIDVFLEVNKSLYFAQMQHQHNQCFLKQSRESCLLVSEFTFGNKYSIVSKSVEHELCPRIETVKRLNVIKAGWVIEPREKNGKTFTKIYYVVVTEIPDVPQFVINQIGKRQPLSIAFLRDFINQTC